MFGQVVPLTGQELPVLQSGLHAEPGAGEEEQGSVIMLHSHSHPVSCARTLTELVIWAER